MRIWGGFVGLALAFAGAACGGVTNDPDPIDGSGGSDGSGSGGSGGSDPAGCTPGDWSGYGTCTACICQETGVWACMEGCAECVNGETREADDGCNTCSCQSGSWVCTTAACDPGPECEEGDTMPAGDDCNTCSCIQGRWGCTLVYCLSDCEPGTVKAAGDDCNTCSCSDDGRWACTDAACSEPACPVPDGSPEPPCPGDTLIARSQGTDACCELCGSYDGYHYYDSLEACEASKACTPGETKYADDECNTCECSADGTWACTNTFCEPVRCGGFSGGTCTEDEYCAYEANIGGCGAGDASAICRPRPTECPEEDAPVCSCSGETFSSSCLANQAGYGVSYTGECQ